MIGNPTLSRLARTAEVPTWAGVLAALAIIVARKPWALTTPQLWAEDGSVHLNLVDRWGFAGLFVPDRGYLNLVPRAVAWLAKSTADVANWPAIYNTGALLVTAIVLARLASPRIRLPAKPWLALAFSLVPCSGEVFINLANVHWLTGFVFVFQALTTRPTTTAQRIGDHAILIIAGLTDPSAIIFLPLLGWRWWQDRDADSLAVVLVTGGCAAVQGWTLLTTGMELAGQSAPLDLIALLQRAGVRLAIGPVLGPQAVALVPTAVLTTVAWAGIASLITWAARPHERRGARLTVIGAWFLVSAACTYRIRPDQWGVELSDLGFAEPYFYMSRLLLGWLLIWEFDAVPRAVAIAARSVWAVSLILNLPRYREPAPPDYHWTEHCDPIRRGIPAQIPTLPEGWILQYPGRAPAGSE